MLPASKILPVMEKHYEDKFAQAQSHFKDRLELDEYMKVQEKRVSEYFIMREAISKEEEILEKAYAN